MGSALGRPRRRHFLRRLPRDAVGAEVGVFRGQYTRDILKIARPRELHLIDAWWTLYGERFPDWGKYTDFGRLTTRAAYEEAVTAVETSRRGKGCVFHVGDDKEILRRFDDGYFDWVYLDSSHEFEHTREELEILNGKVTAGGLITGDDWQDDPAHPHHGVSRAVRWFCAEYGWELVHVDGFAQWCIARRRA